MDREDLMSSFLTTVGVKKEKGKGKHNTIVRKEGEEVVVEVKPFFVAKSAGQASSTSGFAKGEVTRQNLDN